MNRCHQKSRRPISAAVAAILIKFICQTRFVFGPLYVIFTVIQELTVERNFREAFTGSGYFSMIVITFGQLQTCTLPFLGLAQITEFTGK